MGNKNNGVLDDSDLEREITGMDPVDFSKGKKEEKSISDNHRLFYDTKADFELLKNHTEDCDEQSILNVEKLISKIEVYIEEDMDVKQSLLDEFISTVENVLEEHDFEPGDYSDHRSHEDDDDWDDDEDYDEDDTQIKRISLDSEDITSITVDKVKEWALDPEKGPKYALEQLNRLPEQEREDILRQVKS